MSDARAAAGRQTTGGTFQALEALGEKAAPLRCTGGEANKETQ
ncbi:hypothetical protein [Streptomyces monashensis]|nr:hypothetical protein [Streptomyces monashensis]